MPTRAAWMGVAVLATALFFAATPADAKRYDAARKFGRLVVRPLVGVYEFVMAPFPVPAGYEPILQPEFPWDYFE